MPWSQLNHVGKRDVSKRLIMSWNASFSAICEDLTLIWSKLYQRDLIFAMIYNLNRKLSYLVVRFYLWLGDKTHTSVILLSQQNISHSLPRPEIMMPKPIDLRLLSAPPSKELIGSPRILLAWIRFALGWRIVDRDVGKHMEGGTELGWGA